VKIHGFRNPQKLTKIFIDIGSAKKYLPGKFQVGNTG
jgi:hypothetical protein